MINLNYIISKNNNKLVIIDPSTVIDPSDIVQINFSLVGFNNPSTVKISLEFTNGAVINNTYLYASVNNPEIFVYDLTEAVNRNINYGESETVSISNITIVDETAEYVCTDKHNIRLYKTNTLDTFTPDDKQKIYIALNDLQMQLNKLKGE